jgi:hypothetical protein
VTQAPTSEATPAAPEQAPAAAPASPAFSAPPLEIATAGWDGIDAPGWSEDEAGGGAPATETPPAPEQTQQQQPSTPSALPSTAEVDALIAKLDSGEVTSEQFEKIKMHPSVRDYVKRAAESLHGNWKQQQERQQQAEAEAEAEFKALEDWATTVQNWRRTAKPEEYDAWLERNPNALEWEAKYRKAKATRANGGGDSISVEQARALVGESLGTWNQQAAAAFGQAAKAIPFYAELPADLRRDLEAGTQSKTDVPWAHEYVDRLTAGFLKWHEGKLAARSEAVRNEMLAEEGTPGPVILSGSKGGPQMSATEILSRHMEYGFNVDEGGVTEEQLKQAKRSKGME